MSPAEKSSRTEQIEIERKYDVDGLAQVPDLAGVGTVASCSLAEPVALRAVYFDTAEQVLLANRITVRRREGGHDEGWHVKLPGGSGARREVHAPLGADPGEPLPAALRRVVEVVLRGRPLHPVLVLATKRTVTRLLDVDGDELAELADDEVTATAPAAESSHSWREWEVELAPGVARSDGEALLDEVGDRLERAGASASASKSKLARGLGEPLPGALTLVPAEVEPGSAAEFVLGGVGRLVDDLKALDAGVRDGEAEAVHRFRTTIRRLRSILRVYRGVVDSESSALLGDALARVGRAAGSTRDLQVAGDELDLDLNAAPEGFVAHETVGRLRAGLREASREAGRDLERDLDDASYFELLDRLDVLLATEPTGPAASDGATKFAAARLAKEAKRARRRAEVATVAYRETGDCDPAVVHSARKAARRLRYAIEAQRAAGLKGALSPKASHALQDALGAALDAGAAAERFVAAAHTARWAGEDTFGYGVLATLASARRDAALARLPKLAEKL
ncbi:CHAD domain-containing protein [Frondihabitans sucicola]|uniref:CHAD domain-containing protein n=1 Tax=Frondihabitans sucicola TaxID=1268041 RepID=A0ABN6XYH6_9MICO|nr:CYTH and CHAD domain-containing protein [Frondihabitans sucicola]BDZ50092.1 CHAD domain-containing protein [Frondihabitans sucicola]